MSGNKSKHRLNAFDIILIVAITILLVASAVRIFNIYPHLGSQSSTQISFVLSVSDLPQGVGEQLREGDKLYDTESGSYLGTVTAISIEAHIQKEANLKTGETVVNEIEGRSDIKITVKCDAKYDGTQYKTNGVCISCGTSYTVRTAKIAVSGSCISITTH